MKAAQYSKMQALARKTRTLYHPCENGLHICGIDNAQSEFITIANFPNVSYSTFSKLKEALQITGEEPRDYVVDFLEGGDIGEDFSISRQMLSRLKDEIAKAVGFEVVPVVRTDFPLR